MSQLLKKRPTSSILDEFGDQEAISRLVSISDQEVVAVEGLSGSDQQTPLPLLTNPLKLPQQSYANYASSSEDSDSEVVPRKKEHKSTDKRQPHNSESSEQAENVFDIFGKESEKHEIQTWVPLKSRKSDNPKQIIKKDQEEVKSKSGNCIQSLAAHELFSILPQPKSGEAVQIIIEEQESEEARQRKKRESEQFKAPLPLSNGRKVIHINANDHINFKDWQEKRRREMLLKLGGDRGEQASGKVQNRKNQLSALASRGLNNN